MEENTTQLITDEPQLISQQSYNSQEGLLIPDGPNLNSDNVHARF